MGERDRDRILNTHAFRRLAGVTQVVSAAEGEVFHNRLTHSLEVAQIGRRIAEHLARTQRAEAEDLGGLDPEVVDGAGLAHDLGHPPFGHIAEDELQRLAAAAGVSADHFEGNAQTFRILTFLAVRSEEADFPGLNLTRASLNAVLKYPNLYTSDSGKWNAYESERDIFEWARELPPGGTRRGIEAEIMDWADDIAYAVNDLDDFYRAGWIPIDRLRSAPEKDVFIAAAFAEWAERGIDPPPVTRDEASNIIDFMFGRSVLKAPYAGTREQEAQLKILTSTLVGRYVRAITLRPHPTEAQVLKKTVEYGEVQILKQLTRVYVLKNPALAAQQHGQREIVRRLFAVFLEAATVGEPKQRWLRRVLPRRSEETLTGLEALYGTPLPVRLATRVAIDTVAGLTEQQAIDLYHRLTGQDRKSVLEPIVH